MPQDRCRVVCLPVYAPVNNEHQASSTQLYASLYPLTVESRWTIAKFKGDDFKIFYDLQENKNHTYEERHLGLGPIWRPVQSVLSVSGSLSSVYSVIIIV